MFIYFIFKGSQMNVVDESSNLSACSEEDQYNELSTGPIEGII